MFFSPSQNVLHITQYLIVSFFFLDILSQFLIGSDMVKLGIDCIFQVINFFL
jgi:hypothetical protein